VRKIGTVTGMTHALRPFLSLVLLAASVPAQAFAQTKAQAAMPGVSDYLAAEAYRKEAFAELYDNAALCAGNFEFLDILGIDRFENERKIWVGWYQGLFGIAAMDDAAVMAAEDFERFKKRNGEDYALDYIVSVTRSCDARDPERWTAQIQAQSILPEPPVDQIRGNTSGHQRFALVCLGYAYLEQARKLTQTHTGKTEKYESRRYNPSGTVTITTTYSAPQSTYTYTYPDAQRAGLNFSYWHDRALALGAGSGRGSLKDQAERAVSGWDRVDYFGKGTIYGGTVGGFTDASFEEASRCYSIGVVSFGAETLRGKRYGGHESLYKAHGF
jgi:hypothetical protein